MLGIPIEEVVREYSPSIYRFILRMTRDEVLTADIVQETFIKCWQKSAHFDPEKASFKTWIFTIAYRTALDQIRKNSTREKYETLESSYLKQPDTSIDEDVRFSTIDEIFKDLSPLPDELFEKSEVKYIVEKAVNSLRPEYRSVISLHHELGLSFSEIAKVTNTSANTLKSQYRRALQELAKNIKRTHLPI